VLSLVLKQRQKKEQNSRLSRSQSGARAEPDLVIRAFGDNQSIAQRHDNSVSDNIFRFLGSKRLRWQFR
jgi:hypothetical protein